MEIWLNQSSTNGFILLGIFSHSPADSVLFSVVMVIFTVAFCGNVLLIFLICISLQLHTPMYFFLGQLSLMDLMLVGNIVPKMAVNLLSGRKSISFVGCGIQIGLFVFLVRSEGLLLGFIAYDHYVAISHPLHYPIVMSQRLCLQIVEGSWAFGIIDGLIQMVVVMTFPYCGLRKVNHFFCEMLSLLRLACADTSLFENMTFICFLCLPAVPSLLHHHDLLFSHPEGCAPYMCSAHAYTTTLAMCPSHLTAVSLFLGTAMFIYMRPSQYQAPSHDKVVLTPMLNPLIYSLRNQGVMGAPKKGLGHCKIDIQH